MVPDKKFSIEPKPYLLKNKIQHYAWGSKGEDAFIPKLLGLKADAGKAYAELWIGSHPKASSIVETALGEIPLSDLLESNAKDILGLEASERFSNKLPFLLKVLSAGEALSIQAHPNKKQAEILHAKDPENYPDENHKPEIAIAINSLTALAGFRSYMEIKAALDSYSELKRIAGKEVISEFEKNQNPDDFEERTMVKALYESIMRNSLSDHSRLDAEVSALKRRLLDKPENTWNEEERLFLELERQYGSDVGLFSVFILRIVKISKGEAVFLDAGIPHAYIGGDIVECMANSDNVVRAGLTPKFKDVETLISILTYDLSPVKVLDGGFEKEEVIYETPVKEFRVSRFEYKSQRQISVNGSKALSVLLILEGGVSIKWKNTQLYVSKGNSVLVPASLEDYELGFEAGSLVFKVEIP